MLKIGNQLEQHRIEEAAKHSASGDTKQAQLHATEAPNHVLQANKHSEAALKNSANSAAAVK